VSVRRDQQDAQQFWLEVLQAIRESGATGDRRTRRASPALEGDAIVEAIVSELAELPKAFVLIIDDLHELRSAEAVTQLEHLLAILPRSAHVVLSSRRDPPIWLHRLRLADEVSEIRGRDLRFTERETKELLEASGIGLSESGASALHQRTEGWAAGLRLAVISLSGGIDPERLVHEFSGTDRAIGEYLMAEMLVRQPQEVQNMLLRTSLVDRLNGELADLLAGRSGSERMLLELEDANAFVVSLDPERRWFRYHQLLVDFLRLELRRRSADEVPDLHRRAARWFADHAEIVEAVRHTLASGDWPDAARLLADHLFSLTLDGQERTIAALLRSFPRGASADHSELALAHAAVQLAQGQLDEAAARLAVAESHLQSVAPARRSRLAVATASLRLALARRSGRFTEVVEQVNLLDASIADGSNQPITMGSELRAVALMNLGIVETWSGRFDDAERHLSEGAQLAQTIGRPYLELACRAHLGFPSKLVSVETASERGRQAVELAERHGWEDRPILAPALGAVAASTIWIGDFDEAEGWLRRAWEVAEPQIDPAAAVHLHMVTGMLHAGRGQRRPALEEFSAAVQAQSPLTGVHVLAALSAGWLAATQARLGMLDQAHATLSGFSAERDPTDVIDIARAVVSIAEGDPAMALDVLQNVRAPSAGFPAFALVEAHLLASVAHLALGDRHAAVAAAEAALAVAEPDRLIFPFAMIEVAEVLDALPGHETAHGALLADIAELRRGASVSSLDRARLSEVEDLSPSELRVLRLLPTNLTRPEIARSLHVSVNTVSTHIRSIYSKLGASDRSSAVRRARELRLLAVGRAASPPK
jgi:LuxR family transcriptional regulator, maltose regulon positive regulatory protein